MRGTSPAWTEDSLTWTLPLGAALVSVDQHGEAQQAAVGAARGEGAALGFVEQDQLVVDADVLRALIDDHRVRRLDGKQQEVTLF